MLKDFHESSSGIGVVGFVIGFFVLAALLGLGMAVHDDLIVFPVHSGKEAPESLDSKIKQLENRLKMTQSQIESEQGHLEKLEASQEAQALFLENQDELSAKIAENQKLEEEFAVMSEELVTVGVKFEEYRNRYRNSERTMAKGEIIDLSETKGPAFKESKIIGISPLHLRVLLVSGPTGIPYQELPKNVQDRFQFDAEEAAAYTKVLSSRNAKTDQRIADFRKKESERKAVEAVEQKRKRANEILNLIQQQINLAAKLDRDSETWRITAARKTVQANNARANGKITADYALATQARAKSKRYKDQASKARAAVGNLRAELAQIKSALAKIKSIGDE